MQINNINLLKAISKITNRESKVAIKMTLLDELEKLIPFDIITLFKVDDTGENQLELLALRSSDNADFDLIMADSTIDDAIQKCVDEKTYITQTAQQAGLFAVFPLCVSGKVYAALTVFSNSLDAKLIEIVNLLTQITGNVLHTIHHSQIDTLTGLLNRKTLEKNLSEFFQDLKPRSSVGLEGGCKKLVVADRHK